MKWRGIAILVLLAIACFNFSGCGNGTANVIDTVACPIGPAVSQIRIAEPYYNKKVQLKTNLFYGANKFKRVWLKRSNANNRFRAFAKEVQESSTYGLEPEEYHISELNAAVDSLYDKRDRSNAEISNLDIRITASFFLYTTHLLEGRIRHRGAKQFLWERTMPLENDIALLLRIESVSDLRKEMEALHPQDLQYKKLCTALKQYRELEQVDTFPAISRRIKLEPGSAHDAVPLIRKRLSLENDRLQQQDTGTVYGNALVKSVKEFQVRHGLEPDGIINAETVQFLNMPIREKTRVISLNLERLRWHPRIKGEKDEIVVNVPEFTLSVFKNKSEKLQMRVVLGAGYTPTPVFHDTLKYIVFSPTWNVPQSIFKDEFLPKLKENPMHFSRERFAFFKNGIEIDPTRERWKDKEVDPGIYRVVENPGEANSLGKLKFIMPNDFSIYLHDTPADHLFSEKYRALSHGCIRLEKPVALASYLLADQRQWTENEIRQAMESDEPVKADLKKVYPVYIVYRTAWVDDNNKVHFREDIYGHDERQLARLQ
jgi:murein L,D-transpeptidase YcbB/YkuD